MSLSTLKLRLQSFLARFQQDSRPPVSLSQREASILLEAAHREGEEYRQLLGDRLYEQSAQSLAGAAEQAGLPDKVSLVSHSPSSMDMENAWVNMLRQVPGNTNKPTSVDDVDTPIFELPRPLAARLAELAYRHCPERVGGLPVGLLGELDLSSEQLAQLLHQTPRRKDRQRLMQATGQQPFSFSPSPSR